MQYFMLESKAKQTSYPMDGLIRFRYPTYVRAIVRARLLCGQPHKANEEEEESQ